MGGSPCVCRKMAILSSIQAAVQYGHLGQTARDVNRSGLSCKRTITFASMMDLVTAPGLLTHATVEKQGHGSLCRYETNFNGNTVYYMVTLADSKPNLN